MEKSKSSQPLFSKLQQPVDSLTINFSQIGLFALPDQYIMDEEITELNYEFNFGSFIVKDGKIKMREKTEEELWQEEQFKLNKGKKKKKGEPPSKEEIEKIEYFNAIKAEDIRRLEEMGEKERFYDVKEDKFKNDFLVWEVEEEIEEGGEGEAENTTKKIELEDDEEEEIKEDPGFSVTLTGDELVEFEERALSKNSGFWVYVKRYSPMEEEAFIKARKKAKGKTGYVYNPCIFKAFLDLNDLKIEESKEVMLRTRIWEREKAPDEELDLFQDCPTYEPEDAYMRVKVKLSNTLNPRITEPQIQTKDLIPKKKTKGRYSRKDKVLDEFKSQIKEEIMILTKEYYEMYNKELEHDDYEKNKDLKLNVNKRLKMRKNEFVERFKKSSQFDELKKRLSSHIVNISNACFKMKQDLKGLTRSSYDKIFSDLYKVMLTTMKEAMVEKIDEGLDESETKIINSKSHMETKVYRVVEATTHEDKKTRFLKLIEEYENYGLSTITINRAKLLVDEGNTDVISKYCSLLLKSSQFFKAEDYLGRMIRQTGGNEESLLIMTLLFLNKGKRKESLVVMTDLLKMNPENIIYHIIMGYIYKILEEELQSLRSLALAKRIALRKFGKILYGKESKMNDNGIGSKPDPLTEKETDSMYIDTAMTIIKLNFSSLAKIFYEKIINKEAIEAKLVEIELVIRDGNVMKAAKLLHQLSKIFPDDKELLQLYSKNQIQLKRHKTGEKLLMRLITLRGNLGVTLTRLGYLKIKRHKYEEARITFYRAVQVNKRSIMAWLGLGKSCVLLNQYNDALSALKFANILDPLNPEVWLHITQVSLRDITKRTQTVFSLRELVKLKFMELTDLTLMTSLILELQDKEFYDYSTLLITKLSEDLENSEVNQENSKKLWIEICKCYEQIGDREKAKWAFEKYETSSGEISEYVMDLAVNLKERLNE